MHDALTLFKLLSGSAMGLLVALAPLAVYLLLGSLLLALLAPLGLLLSYPFLAFTDVYFVGAWIVLFGLPIVYLVLERGWGRRLAFSLLAVAAVAASATNAVRAHAGTGVGVALALAALLRRDTWRARLAGLALVAACYAAVSPLGMSAIRSHSYHRAHVQGSVSTAHPLWHSVYLGLGYLPNAWGIRWRDSVGFATARRVDPGVVLGSPEYERILRHRYFQIVEHHPLWVARLYAVKTAALVWDATKHGGGVLVLLVPLGLFMGRRRLLLRRELLLMVPAFLIAAIPPVLAVPQDYDPGFVACLDLAGALALGGLVGRRLGYPPRRAIVLVAILAGCIVAAAIGTQLFAAQVASQIGS